MFFFLYNPIIFRTFATMIIEVSGLREPDNIHDVCNLGVDRLAFDYRKDSERRLGSIYSLAGYIPDYSALKKVLQKEEALPVFAGRFADEMPQTIVTHIVIDRLDMVYLMGDELPVMLENLRRTVVPDINPHLIIYKALTIAEVSDISRCEEYAKSADGFMFCLPTKPADINSWLEQYTLEKPFILSVPIGPEDGEWVRALSHPMLAGIAIGEGFEQEPAIIDTEKLRRFMEELKD